MRCHLADGRRDPPLQRMLDIEVVVDRPAVDPTGGQHRRVLAGAVLLDRRGLDPEGASLGPGDGIVGPGRGVAQVGLVEPERFEHPPDPLDVDRRPVVAGAGEGDRIRRRIEAERDHGGRLERLERRARIDNRVGVAHTADHPPVGVERDGHTVM
jgi:hypothetical protein